jgi:hypothetical protein
MDWRRKLPTVGRWVGHLAKVERRHALCRCLGPRYLDGARGSVQLPGPRLCRLPGRRVGTRRLAAVGTAAQAGAGTGTAAAAEVRVEGDVEAGQCLDTVASAVGITAGGAGPNSRTRWAHREASRGARPRSDAEERMRFPIPRMSRVPWNVGGGPVLIRLPRHPSSGATVSAECASSAARSAGRWGWPFTRRNCFAFRASPRRTTATPSDRHATVSRSWSDPGRSRSSIRSRSWTAASAPGSVAPRAG